MEPNPKGGSRRIWLSRETAYLLLRLAEELSAIDRRAGCSDRYFRQHFTSVARAAAASGALDEIRRSLAARIDAPVAAHADIDPNEKEEESWKKTESASR